MSSFEELARMASDGARRIFVAQEQIDLRPRHDGNYIFFLELPTERTGVAGGLA